MKDIQIKKSVHGSETDPMVAVKFKSPKGQKVTWTIGFKKKDFGYYLNGFVAGFQ